MTAGSKYGNGDTRAAQARGLRWQLDGAPPKLRQLAGLYGVEALLWAQAQPG